MKHPIHILQDESDRNSLINTQLPLLSERNTFVISIWTINIYLWVDLLNFFRISISILTQWQSHFGVRVFSTWAWVKSSPWTTACLSAHAMAGCNVFKCRPSTAKQLDAIYGCPSFCSLLQLTQYIFSFPCFSKRNITSSFG